VKSRRFLGGTFLFGGWRGGGLRPCLKNRKYPSGTLILKDAQRRSVFDISAESWGGIPPPQGSSRGWRLPTPWLPSQGVQTTIPDHKLTLPRYMLIFASAKGVREKIWSFWP